MEKDFIKQSLIILSCLISSLSSIHADTIFEDDFEEADLSQYTIRSSSGEGPTARNGKLVFSNKSHSSRISKRIYLKTNRDFEVSFKIKFNKGKAKAWAGIDLIEGEDFNHRQHRIKAYINSKLQGHLEQRFLDRHHQSETHTLDPKTAKSADGFHTVQLRRTGNFLLLYINGQLHSIDDNFSFHLFVDELTSLVIYTDANTKVEIDKVSVRYLEYPDAKKAFSRVYSKTFYDPDHLWKDENEEGQAKRYFGRNDGWYHFDRMDGSSPVYWWGMTKQDIDFSKDFEYRMVMRVDGHNDESSLGGIFFDGDSKDRLYFTRSATRTAVYTNASNSDVAKYVVQPLQIPYYEKDHQKGTVLRVVKRGDKFRYFINHKLIGSGDAYQFNAFGISVGNKLHISIRSIDFYYLDWDRVKNINK